MPHNTLPDDLNPALIEVCARFIGKLTGLVPPPVADFPPEMHAVFHEFAAAAYAVVRENVATSRSRAVVSADDQQDATRWRALLKDGEPEVYVERTERRAIPVPPTTEPWSQKFVGETRPVSEMWVRRYAVYAWWAREYEHRTFTEAVDAASAGESR
ncbi:hypothetical protein [Burkholderia ubonensis]|uniref:hypothetical protein n=1 Tax=Burkholderia ubonensis TaxID=101571 RepID=UPI0008FDD02D|nr:hypothetical protein [Burkholderia ubonensis]OJB35406.1 hypothetical protein BGV48_00325 [Burkholderia ubonensis]